MKSMNFFLSLICVEGGGWTLKLECMEHSLQAWVSDISLGLNHHSATYRVRRQVPKLLHIFAFSCFK